MLERLETERMVLRRLEPGDLDGVHELFSDPEVMRFSITGPRDRAACREWLEAATARHEQHGHGFLAAISRDDGRYLGHVGLLAQELDGEPRTEIAYWLARRAWGRGLATEGARACRDWGFEILGRDALYSFIHIENTRSMRVAERVGLRNEGNATWKGMEICVYRIGRDDERPRGRST